MKYTFNSRVVLMFFVAVIIVISGSLIYLSVKQNLAGPAKPDQNQGLPVMSELEARAIAEATCIKGGGALKSGGTYNSNSNTWWFDANLNATKPGCNPACVVSAETKTAEINWRCTGAIPPAANTGGTTGSPSTATGGTTNTTGGKVLDLSNRGLTRLATDIFNRPDVTVLNVSGNKLTGALPAEIRQLTNLVSLNASNNQLTGIPAEIGQLAKLETVNFANNGITGLPLEIGNLKKLKTIDLSGNDYSTYDMSLIKKSLPSLQVIGEKVN